MTMLEKTGCDNKGFLLMPDQGFDILGSERVRRGEIIDCFKQTGLTRTILAKDQIQGRG
jgi:hypothetical protein